MLRTSLTVALAGSVLLGAQPPGPTHGVSREFVLEILLSDVDEPWRLKHRLVAAGDRAFPVYDELLADPRTSVSSRCRILEVITVVKGDRSRYVPAALAALTHDSSILRICALGTLSKIGSAKDTAPIVAALFDNDSAVINRASIALSAIGGPNDLLAMDSFLRAAAVRGLHPAFLADIRKDRDALNARLQRELRHPPLIPAAAP